VIARDSALAFAKEKFPDEAVSCVALLMAVRHTLDIQNPEIRPLIEEVARIVTERADVLGLYIEPNSDLTRGASHFALGMFFELYEANFGRPLDVVRARIGRGYVPPVEPDCSHELCVKRKEVIVELREIRTVDDLRFVQAINPWQLSNLQRRAAQKAVDLARALSDPGFIDLAVRVAEGCGPTFQNKPRFEHPKRISLFVGGSQELASEVQRVWPASAGSPASVINLEDFDGLRKHERIHHMDEALNRSNGIVAVADNSDPILHGTMWSLLARSIARHLPTLALTTKIDSLPLDIFSAHNSSIIALKPRRQRPHQIATALEGFLSNGWKSETLLFRLELMNVARGHCPSSKPTAQRKKNYSNFKSIVDAVKGNYLIAQDRFAFESERDFVLSELPIEPESAAELLREDLNVDSFSVKPYHILRAMNAKSIQACMSISGYRIPEGYFGPCAVVALNRKDDPARQKFTMAHELGHAIVDVAGEPLRCGVFDGKGSFRDEEEFCDLFAAAFTMPLSQVNRYAEQVEGLEDWLGFPDCFEVSVSAAARRLWTLRRLLLVYAHEKAREESPAPANTEELLRIGAKLDVGEKYSAKLSNGAPFCVRRTKHGIQAIADFSKLGI
jgi:Zn-dependent peptidase ImmA (M78 family)